MRTAPDQRNSSQHERALRTNLTVRRRRQIRLLRAQNGHSYALVHWKKSPAALFVPIHCATLSLLRASPGWPSWPPVRRGASHPWTAPFGSTSGRPNALLARLSDISSVSAGKKRGFCQLRSRGKCKSDRFLGGNALGGSAFG